MQQKQPFNYLYIGEAHKALDIFRFALSFIQKRRFFWGVTSAKFIFIDILLNFEQNLEDNVLNISYDKGMQSVISKGV